MSHVLVTGGAGFIGSALARRLVAEGHEVTVADNFSSGFRANVPAGVRIVQADLATERGTKALEKVPLEVVCHLAGQSSGEASFDDPEKDFGANGRSTLLLSRLAESRGARVFLHASSMSVYGTPPGLPVPETAPLRPMTYYGASKAYAEHTLGLSDKSMRTASLRMFSVYGPGQDLSNMRQGMVSIFLSYILAGGPVVVKGSLERVRDLVHVEDVVDAWMAAITRDEARGPINIGTGHGTSVSDMIEQLSTGAGMGLPKVREASATPGDQQKMIADIRRARQMLGWIPKVDAISGLRRMSEWGRSLQTTDETIH